MKINFKQIVFYFLLVTTLISCDQEEEVNYTPQVYTPSPSLTVETTNVTDNSFDVNFTSQADGIVYYAIQLSDVAVPSAENVILKNSGSIVNLQSSLTSGNIWSYTMDENIYGAYNYSIYSVMASVDGIASSVIRTDVTTLDTVDPTFDRDNTSPAHNVQPGTNSPFRTINLAFSEPVFYQGGDVTFTGFFSGRTITVNTASAFSTNGTTVSIDHDPFLANDDAIIVTWEAGTFKDNAGKSVVALTGFDYYFWTRDFTADEATDLLIGDWDYQITNNAFNPAVLSTTTGTWSVRKGTTPRTIILTNQVDHDINAFVGADDSATVEFEVTVGTAGTLGSGVGYLTIAPVKSGIGIDLYGDGTEAYWVAYYQDFITPIVPGLAGFYDLNTKTMLFRLDYGSIAGFNNPTYYFGDIRYDYTYVPGSGALGRPSTTTTNKSNEILKVENVTPSVVNPFTKSDLLNLKSKNKIQLNTVLN